MARARRRRAASWPFRLGTAGPSPWLRRGALAVVLLVVAFFPYSSGSQGLPALAAPHQPAAASMLKWTETKLPGTWTVLPGLTGTVPDSGQAYASVSNGIAALGAEMTVYAYSASSGKLRWQVPLLGFPAGAQIVSVRTWPGEVTAGVSYADRRTEVVITSEDGTISGDYPASPAGGAVAGGPSYTVIVGPTAVTSYDNATGHVKWTRQTGDVAQNWQLDGQYLYVAESTAGDLGTAPVTALRQIDTATGNLQQILPSEPIEDSPAYRYTPAFAGTLTGAFDGVVLFSSATEVTAYSGDSGQRLWSMADALPEGDDPAQGRLYLARGTNLLAVSPLTGRIRATVPASGLYTVRNGIALGLDTGQGGDAWGLDVAAQRVAMTVSGLGWPHYFVDLSGVGGSADPGSDLVVVAACAQAGPAVQATAPATASPGATSSASLSSPPDTSSGSPGSSTSPSTSPSPTVSPTQTAPATQPCLRPELLGLVL